MATMRFKGLEEYELKLAKLESGADEIAGKAIFAGAEVVADAVKRSINALPVRHGGYGTPDKKLQGVTAVQKQGLAEGFGISKMQNEMGFFNVKLGFDGYNRTTTKAYPNGQPNQLVARGAESGTTWLQKSPFVAPAVRQARDEAEKKMADVLDKEIAERML